MAGGTERDVTSTISTNIDTTLNGTQKTKR